MGDPDEAAAPTTGEPRVPIAAIGASAGGLEALSALIRHLLPDRMAFVVLQHLAPTQPSLLVEILARDARMPVVVARDGARLEPGTIFVAPPGVDVTVTNGHLQLSASADGLPRHSIDRLFRSLADDLGELAVGVVLSGVGHDGTAGLRAIKAAGGIAIVQDPSTAGQAGMPQSALDAGCVDLSLAPAEIGEELMRLASDPYVARKPPQFAEHARAQLLGLLHQAFGIDFSAYKESTIVRRIQRRMAIQKCARLDDYVALVRDTPGELEALYADLLIGVTAFFRDGAPFELLKTAAFPDIVERANTDPDAVIRIWVPGCATGEEAYSVAICLLEYLDHKAAGYRIQIFATDIDDDALRHGRQAVYSKHLEVDVSAERLGRFFTRHDDGYQVARFVRDLVVFAHHNLAKDPPFSRLDLVSCRNVLIYMQPALQQKVVRAFHYALKPDGVLLLGPSESVGDAADLFALVDRKHKLYKKKHFGSAAIYEFSGGRSRALDPPAVKPGVRVTVTAQQLADRKVLDRFGPPGVLLDQNLDVVQFRGETGPFLSPVPGDATLNILKLIRPELLLELSAGIAEVSQTNVTATREVRLLDGTSIVLELLPIHAGAEHHDRALLVLFREFPGSTLVAPTSPDAPGSEAEARIAELERELLITKEYLQTSVQELQSSNEELQSSNEELQSSNEELQSSNEELETSKEELQSTNEELATVNEELQNHMTQLASSIDDLQNVLAVASVALVFVDPERRIRRFSAAAERLLSLIPSDVGRPVAALGTALDAPQLDALVAETIETMHERTQRVRCADGQPYTMRVLPFRTGDHAIRGALLEIVKTPPRRTLGEMPEVQELAGKILSTLPDVLMLLDEHLRLIWVNRAFFDAFRVGAEVLGQPLDELWIGVRGRAALWAALDHAVTARHDFGPLEVAHPFDRAAAAPMLFSGRCIAAEHERPALVLVMMKDRGPKEGA